MRREPDGEATVCKTVELSSILSRRSRKEFMKRHEVMVKDPHIQSQAALVLLCDKYTEESISQWLKFKDEYIKEYLKEHDKLECAYCGRDDLVIENEGRRQHANLATLDHIHPLSKGGSKYDPENIAIACYKCNQEKGNK